MSPLVLRWYSKFCFNHLFKFSSVKQSLHSFQLSNHNAISQTLSSNCAQIRGLAKSSIVKDKKHKKPKVILSQEEMNKVINVEEFEHHLNSIYNKLKDDYNNNLSLKVGSGIENLNIVMESESFMIKDVAQISSKPPNLLVINCSNFPEVIKATIETINKSGLNVNVQQEGTIIYVQLPKMTHDHRENLAKSAKTFYNKAKDDITRVQNNFIRMAKKSTHSGVSEDTIFDATENIRFKSHQMTESLENLLKLKTKELLGE